MLIHSSQKAQRKVERLRTSAFAGLILSADRQSLTLPVIETEQSKPVYLLKHRDSEPQGTLMDVRVKEVRESKCLAVMVEIAVGTAMRKHADFGLVFYHDNV